MIHLTLEFNDILSEKYNNSLINIVNSQGIWMNFVDMYIGIFPYYYIFNWKYASLLVLSNKQCQLISVKWLCIYSLFTETRHTNQDFHDLCLHFPPSNQFSSEHFQWSYCWHPMSATLYHLGIYIQMVFFY